MVGYRLQGFWVDILLVTLFAAVFGVVLIAEYFESFSPIPTTLLYLCIIPFLLGHWVTIRNARNIHIRSSRAPLAEVYFLRSEALRTA